MDSYREYQQNKARIAKTRAIRKQQPKKKPVSSAAHNSTTRNSTKLDPVIQRICFSKQDSRQYRSVLRDRPIRHILPKHLIFSKDYAIATVQAEPIQFDTDIPIIITNDIYLKPEIVDILLHWEIASDIEVLEIKAMFLEIFQHYRAFPKNFVVGVNINSKINHFLISFTVLQDMQSFELSTHYPYVSELDVSPHNGRLNFGRRTRTLHYDQFIYR